MAAIGPTVARPRSAPRTDVLAAPTKVGLNVDPGNPAAGPGSPEVPGLGMAMNHLLSSGVCLAAVALTGCYEGAVPVDPEGDRGAGSTRRYGSFASGPGGFVATRRGAGAGFGQGLGFALDADPAASLSQGRSGSLRGGGASLGRGVCRDGVRGRPGTRRGRVRRRLRCDRGGVDRRGRGDEHRRRDHDRADDRDRGRGRARSPPRGRRRPSSAPRRRSACTAT